MATTTWKGHAFTNNTTAAELHAKKDEAGFTKHMAEVARAAKELPERYAHLEKPPAVGATRWIPGMGLMTPATYEMTKRIN